MIYLFHGTDIEKTRTKAFEWVAKARAKEPNLAYVRLAREELTNAALEDAALSGGLFVKRLLILIDDPFSATRTASEEEGSEEESTGNILEEHLDNLAVSDNAIIILAPKLAAVKAKKLAAKAKIEYKYDSTAAREDARGFNSNLVNALSARSREKLWLEINRALYAGDAPEMLHGLLHWKARDLMEKGSRAWSPKESRQLSLSLIELLQSSRRGGLDLSLSLEQFALSL
jgi:DNA polymerase III delta subunit